MKQKKYHWQPELSTAIIYWSCTFAILFMSLILSLENTRPYLVSNSVLAVFFLFVFLGFNRYFKLSEENMYIHYFFPFHKKVLRLSDIQMVKVGTKSIEIISPVFSSNSHIYIMTKKQKDALIEELKVNESFAEKIIYDDQLKLGDH